jgi:hypothetical protein
MRMSKKTRNVTGSVVLVAGLVLGVAACNNSTSQSSGNQKESAQQQADTNTLETNQPLPHFNYSQERQNMIDIETAQANNVLTTSFFMNFGVADPVSSCPSIGFGIPDSASLSNPVQAQWANGGTNGEAGVGIGQQDPTGIYNPLSSAGTFVICLAANGSPYIDRIESNVDTAGGPATWNYTTHSFKLVGAPTAAASAVTGNVTRNTAAKPVALGK